MSKKKKPDLSESPAQSATDDEFDSLWHDTQDRGIIPPGCEEAPRTAAASAHRTDFSHSRRALPMESRWGEIPMADCVPS